MMLSVLGVYWVLASFLMPTIVVSHHDLGRLGPTLWQGLTTIAMQTASEAPPATDVLPETVLPEDSLPEKVAVAVTQQAAMHLNLPLEALQIVEATQKTWPDSCLGLAEPMVFCAQVLTKGWLVTVAGADQQLTYRTNSIGTVVKRED